MKKVIVAELNPEERKFLIRFKDTLKPEIEEAEKMYVTLYPYYGGMGFSAGSPKTGANFFGLFGDVAKDDWKLTFGAQQLSFSVLPSSNYSQQVGLFGASLGLSPSVEGHARLAYMLSNLSSQSGIAVFQTGISTGIGELSRLHLDGFYSYYPSLALGTMRVLQGSAALDQWLYSRPGFELWVNLGFHLEHPFAAQDYDPATQFMLKPNYESVAASLNTRIGSVGFGGSYWTGTEAFGVRDDEAIIFSALEEHHSGWGLNVRYDFSPTVSATAKYSIEHYVVGPLSVTSDSAFGMLTFRF